MEKILVSACLLGEKVRYDGKVLRKDDIFALLNEYYEFLVFCPEMEGGLKCPRDQAERQGDQVLTKSGKILTGAFNLGAHEALRICQYFGITKAILKSHSPSCGRDEIYNGFFVNRLVPGNGMTTDLLIKNKITVYNENELQDLLDQTIIRHSKKEYVPLGSNKPE
jgi:uncharacterized protein YbbK (DUF523 family)